MRAITEAALDSIITIDANGCIVDFNPPPRSASAIAAKTPSATLSPI